MEFNLRKARKLENKIQNLLMGFKNELETSTSVRVNADVQSEVLPALVTARNNFFTNFENVQKLIDARFTVRGLISAANITSGINACILDKVTLENKISTINYLLSGFTTLDEAELNDDSKRYKTQLENGDRFGRTTFETNFLLAKDEEEFKKKQIYYSKQIEVVEDQLLALNFSTSIKLSQDIVALLQTNNLI